MNFKNNWKVGKGPSLKEDKKLKQYHEIKGGLLFREFNTTQFKDGRKRALDAIIFPDLEKDAYNSKGNYDKLKELIKKNPIELVEVHKWGFYGFGQLVGKEQIFKEYWGPKQVKKVLVTLNECGYHPENKPDSPTEEVFNNFDIEVFVPEKSRRKK